MEFRGYRKTLESKIVRIKHRVCFGIGTSAKHLSDYLKHVPGEAKIVDIDDGQDYDEGEKPRMPYIEFEEEKADSQ